MFNLFLPLCSIASHCGYYGIWTNWNETSCNANSFLNGVKIRLQEHKKGNADEVGVINIHMKCTDDTWLESSRPEVTVLSKQGDEAKEQHCSKESVICGVRVKMDEQEAEPHDYAALTSAEFRCCNLTDGNIIIFPKFTIK